MPEVVVIGDTLADISFDLPGEFLHRAQETSANWHRGATAQNPAAITIPFGSKFEAKGYTLGPGGSGANVAVGLNQTGQEVKFVTGLSSDALGQFLTKSLRDLGLRIMAEEHAEPSNLSVVLRIKAERTIITARPDPYRYLLTALPKTGHIHIGPLPAEQDPFFERVLQHCAQTGQTVSCNPRKELLTERGRHFIIMLKSLEILFVNQEEAAILARLPQRSSPAELVRALRRLGPKIVAVTCGEKGAYIGNDNAIYFVEAMSSRDSRVDATGTGDAFVSGFLTGYFDPSVDSEYQGLERAIAYAALNSGAVVTQVGAQHGLLTKEELERGERTVTLKKVEEF